MNLTSLVLCILIVMLAWAALIPVCRIQRLSEPTILGTTFFIAVVAHFVPACVFLFDSTMPKAPAFLWGNTLALGLLPLGGALANLMLRFRSRELESFYSSARTTPPLSGERLLVLTFALGMIGILAMYISEVQSYPFGLLLRGGVDTAILNSLRGETIGRDMGSRFWYLYAVSRSSFMPMLFALVLSGWAFFRGPLERGLAILALLAALVFNSWSGAKTPVAMLFLLGIFVVVMRGPSRRVVPAEARSRAPRRWRWFGAVGVLGSLVVAYPFFVFSRKEFGQTHTAFEVLYEGIFKRVFFKPALLSYYQFEMFPIRYPFTEFRDVGKIAQLFGLQYVDLSQLTSLYWSGSLLAQAPPAAFGNFYSEGGWTVLAIGAITVGFLMQTMQVWFVRRVPRDTLAFGLLAVLLWSGLRVSMTGFHKVLLTEGVIPSLLFIVVWRLWRAGLRSPAQVTLGSVP